MLADFYLLPMLQNIILTKSHFCKKWHFFHLQDFIYDSIHILHLYDRFGAVTINIEDFIGKNSEKITPLFPI